VDIRNSLLYPLVPFIMEGGEGEPTRHVNELMNQSAKLFLTSSRTRFKAPLFFSTKKRALFPI